jgi:hypothetical protein
MKFVTSIVTGEAPRDGATQSIAFGLQGSDALSQILHALHSTRQTATSKDADLNFRHVEPTSMDGACNETLLVAKSVAAHAGSKAS